MSDPSTATATRLRGLRANTFAAVVIILVEYGLGIWVNLYGHLPGSDHGASFVAGYGRAIADGPVGLSIHAVLGAVLLVSAVTAVVRSVLVRLPSLIAATTVGLAAIVAAALSGVRFVGHGTDASSMSMAIAGGVAIGAYALVLLLSPSTPAFIEQPAKAKSQADPGAMAPM